MEEWSQTSGVNTVVSSVNHPMFVGGHPMAGSEAIGVRGASANLFDGAMWVLTPTVTTDPEAQK